MKNISATKGTSRVQIFLMDDRSTAVGDATSTLTPQVGRLGGKPVIGAGVTRGAVSMTIRSTGRPINHSTGRPLNRSSSDRLGRFVVRRGVDRLLEAGVGR